MKITVRLTEDHKNGYMWFEEKLDNGQWVKMMPTFVKPKAVDGVLFTTSKKFTKVYRDR
jgi:hypothetical protein